MKRCRTWPPYTNTDNYTQTHTFFISVSTRFVTQVPRYSDERDDQTVKLDHYCEIMQDDVTTFVAINLCAVDVTGASCHAFAPVTF